MSTAAKSISTLEPFDVRLPRWEKRKLIHRACPICGAEERYEPFVCRPDQLTVVHCGSCGGHFIEPCPGPSALAAFYSAYGSTHWRLSYSSEVAEQMRNPSPQLQEIWKSDPRILGLLKTGALAGKKILDVGCSRGDFLIRARAFGALPTGLDMDREALRFLKTELGISTIFGNVEDVELEPSSYDVITGWDLIEHLLNPRATVGKLVRALKSDGRIAFWTPNGDLIATWGTSWIGFRVDLEHLQYFSSHLLCSLLEEAGARAIHVEAVGIPNLTSWIPPVPERESSFPRLRQQLKKSKLLAKTVQLLRHYRERRSTAPIERLQQRFQGYHLFVIAIKA